MTRLSDPFLNPRGRDDRSCLCASGGTCPKTSRVWRVAGCVCRHASADVPLGRRQRRHAGPQLTYLPHDQRAWHPVEQLQQRRVTDLVARDTSWQVVALPGVRALLVSAPGARSAAAGGSFTYIG